MDEPRRPGIGWVRASTRRLTAAACRLARQESGTTAIEYALICALVFLSFAVGALHFGSGMNNMFNHISTNMR